MTEKNIKNKRYLIISITVVLVLAALTAVFASLYVNFWIPNVKYNEAIALLEEKKYEEALEAFKALDGYKNSEKYVDNFVIRYEKHVIGNTTYPHIFEYTYDEDGKTLKEIETDHNGYINTVEYTYNSNGSVIKEFHSHSNGSSSTVEYVLNDEEKTVKKTITYHDGSSGFVTNYAYNDDGLLVKEIWSTDGNTSGEYDYYYDSNKNLVKKIYSQPNGEIIEYSYTYDDENNLTLEVKTQNNETVSFYEYSYDSRGNKIKIVSLAFGDLFIEEYSYDDNNRIIKKVMIDKDGSLYKTEEFVYDAKGNAVKKTVTMNRSGQVIVYENTYDNDGFLLNEISTNPDGKKKNTPHTYSGKHIFYNDIEKSSGK